MNKDIFAHQLLGLIKLHDLTDCIKYNEPDEDKPDYVFYFHHYFVATIPFSHNDFNLTDYDHLSLDDLIKCAMVKGYSYGKEVKEKQVCDKLGFTIHW